MIRHWALIHGYGNINPLSIDYACRPRLRSRLTLGGLACPRNPWSFGGQGSHLALSLPCLHSHSPPSTTGITRWLHRMQDAPYPRPRRCCGFGGVLEPATLSAHNHLTSELLRTLSRVAASKPTSWLSSRLPHPFPLSTRLGALAGDLGCFPRRTELIPAVSLPRSSLTGIRSLADVSNPSGAHRPSSSSTSGKKHATLHLNAFRGEPAITEFDWPFTPTHSSSPSFNQVGSGLHAVLPALHPGHG